MGLERRVEGYFSRRCVIFRELGQGIARDLSIVPCKERHRHTSAWPILPLCAGLRCKGCLHPSDLVFAHPRSGVVRF